MNRLTQAELNELVHTPERVSIDAFLKMVREPDSYFNLETRLATLELATRYERLQAEYDKVSDIGTSLSGTMEQS